MNWNKDRSTALSMVCVIGFAVVLACLDVMAYPLVKIITTAGVFTSKWQYAAAALMAVIYIGSGFGWVCLWRLWRLLRNIRGGVVFSAENVAHLRAVSWCCIGAAAVSMAGGVVYYPFFVIAGAAGFMALIVRVVKNVFQQAIAMKDELDFTV